MYRNKIILNIHAYSIQEPYTIMQNILKYIPDSFKKLQKSKLLYNAPLFPRNILKITGYLQKSHSFRFHHYVSTNGFRITYTKNLTLWYKIERIINCPSTVYL